MKPKETAFYAFWGAMGTDEVADPGIEGISYWYFYVPMTKQEIAHEPVRFNEELDKSLRDLGKQLVEKGASFDPQFSSRGIQKFNEALAG